MDTTNNTRRAIDSTWSARGTEHVVQIPTALEDKTIGEIRKAGESDQQAGYPWSFATFSLGGYEIGSGRASTLDEAQAEIVRQFDEYMNR